MKSNDERMVDALEVVENSGVNSGQELIQQPHGGALLPGGVPGNKGSTGRPRAELREKFRESGDRGIEALDKILARSSQVVITCKCGEVHKVNPSVTDETKLQALDIAAKYGVGVRQEVEQGEHITVVIDSSLLPPRQDSQLEPE